MTIAPFETFVECIGFRKRQLYRVVLSTGSDNDSDTQALVDPECDSLSSMNNLY